MIRSITYRHLGPKGQLRYKSIQACRLDWPYVKPPPWQVHSSIMSTIQKNTLNEQSLDCESIKWTERTKKIRFEAKDDNRYDATKTQFWEKEISDIRSWYQRYQPIWTIEKRYVKHSTRRGISITFLCGTTRYHLAPNQTIGADCAVPPFQLNQV